MLNTPRLVKPALLALLLTLLQQAEAQTMYRCGQSFQDKPCNAGTAGRIIGTGDPQPTTSPQAVAAVTDPLCAQRGDRAKKIVWAREVGRTKDDQLGNASTQDERLLIEEVYLMRGRAEEVASAVATKCVAEQERARAAAKLAALLAPPQANPPLAAAAADPATDAEKQAAAKASRCKAIDSELRSIHDQERTGGSAGTMDSLRNQKRNAEARRQKEGC